MTIIRSATVAVFAIIGLILSAATALATEAAATTSLNVRSGPGTGYGVVDTLYAGEVVEVTECETNGWCYIEHSGPNGWVSSSYLTMAPDTNGGPSDPDCSLSFTIGPDGPSMSIVCGDGAVVPTPPIPAPPVGNQACFSVNPNYGGAEFCYGVGTLNSLNATFNDRISSVKLYGLAKAKLCVNTNLGGYCRTIVNDAAVLGLFINNKASSLAVFTGAPPIQTPVTFSTGSINLQQTYSANLDNGVIGGPGVDIWYRAVNPMNKMISPRNGAQLALGDGSNRGFAGCSTETYSANPIPIWSIPVGTYVCVRTNQGRTSQFRLNGYVGTTMKLGYTTWVN